MEEEGSLKPLTGGVWNPRKGPCRLHRPSDLTSPVFISQAGPPSSLRLSFFIHKVGGDIPTSLKNHCESRRQ